MTNLRNFMPNDFGWKEHPDMEIIQQIKKKTGKKLKILPLEDIWRENGYSLDGTGQVNGLNLDNSKIIDISFLMGLNGLTHLSLSWNKITDITLLSSLSNLSYVDLRHNEISDPSPLGTLINLTLLDLRDNQITNINPLRYLTNLVKLHLGNNQISDIQPLSTLMNLKELHLYNNKISDYKPLSNLSNLICLNLKHNQISDISQLSSLINLIILNLNVNKITDIMPLSSLTNLSKLHLIGNQITDLTSLKELKNLTRLDVRDNYIQQLPPDIITWWPDMEMKWKEERYSLEGFDLSGNPLSNPPIEIVRKGKAAVENYFNEIQNASVFFLESKLILVGSGDVGKTTLMKKLKDNNFIVEPGKEDTTRGIDIQSWQLTCPFHDGQTHNVNIHCWDFGGQDILHATHQFFLTKRSVYLFIWDPRKEEENRSFDFWLNAVKLFGAGSPLILVMNKADIRIKHIDEASFLERFPNIVQFHQVSCVTAQNIAELTETIRTALSRMPHLLDRLPKRWMDIRSDLKALPNDYITQEDYFNLCRNYGMDREKALFLSDYLHDLGIILQFHQDPILSGTVILKPEWATGAVYALIDSLEIQQNKGHFNRVDLGRYWDKDKYPPEKYPQLLRLIEKFELCFNIVGTDEYILPELLPSQRPVFDVEVYRAPGNLHLHYAYDFMPAGIITRFISRIHYLICNNHYWNNGVELEFSGSSALIVNDPNRKRIRVSVTGSNNTQLMGVIRSHFDHIHETLNMKKEKDILEEVPCNCVECKLSNEPYFYKYHALQKFLLKGKDARCEKSAEDLSVQGLLNGLLPPEKTGNIYESLITTLSQIQEKRKTLRPDENSRNTVLALLLGTRGFRVKDQTLAGSSALGNRLGELDIKIEDVKGRTVSIIEALNLDSCNTIEIDRHVLKLLRNYDTGGLKENYILVYASVNDFNNFCRKYCAHIHQIDYRPYPLKNNSIEETKTGFNKIIAYRARHQCNKGETNLYHLLVEM